MTDGNKKISSENNEEGGSAPKRRRNEAENQNAVSNANDQQHLTLRMMYDTCQEVLEKQKNLEKSNIEIVEKLRSAEEKMEKSSKELGLIKLKIDTIEQSLTNEISSESSDNKDTINSTTFSQQTDLLKSTSSSDSSQAMIPSENIPMAGKYFVLKHKFKNVSKMVDDVAQYSEAEEHFGVEWRMYVRRSSQDHLKFCLRCSQSLDVGKWMLQMRLKLIIITNRNGKVMQEGNKTFTNIEKKRNASGWTLRIESAKMEKDYLMDDQLTAEIHVKIKKTTGIYKENLRSFDETMKEFSDVVLVVNEEKFYVSKLYLATHSPYFKALFLGNFNDSNKSEIKLTGIDPDDFQNYLELLYGERPIDEYTCEGLLLVADMLDTPLVFRQCEKFLLKKTKKTLKKKLELSTRYNLEALKKKCLADIKSIDDLQDVLPGNVQDLDKVLMGELLEKSISLYD